LLSDHPWQYQVDSELYHVLHQIAANTGMRAGELQHMKWDNIDFNNRLLYVRSTSEFRTKTRRDRSIPMNDRVIELLRRRFETFAHEHEYLFCNREGNKLSHETTGKPIKRNVRKVGLNDELHFHSLRHTFAIWAVQSGMPLYAVSKLMGHPTTRMTERYAQFSTGGLHEKLNKI
jgi:integrase